MEKVYLVEYDNGESYEDNYTSVEGIFKTEEGAVKFIHDEGYTKEEQWACLDYKEHEPIEEIMFKNPHPNDFKPYSFMTIRVFDLRD